MTIKEIKELKEHYENMTLGEIKGNYEEKLRISNLHKQDIKELAIELSELDFDNKYYVDKCKNLINDMNFYKSDIKQDEQDLKIIKPVLDKKEVEGINQSEYENYITNNIDIRVLIKKVNEDKQEFINNGSKVIIYGKENKRVEISLTDKEVDEMYSTMLKELIMILKDNIGNITKVESLQTNNHKGFDGVFRGDKGSISINTILAGGYNIQCLHFRTLVYKI